MDLSSMPQQNQTTPSSSANTNTPINTPKSKRSMTTIIGIIVAIIIVGGVVWTMNQPKDIADNNGDAVNTPSDQVDDTTPAPEPVKSDGTIITKPQPVTPVVDPVTGQPKCVVMGCNNEACTSSDKPVITACVVLPEHVCYKTAVCERQASGNCGWTQSAELQACLAQNNK